jgi:ribosomal protein S27E
MSQKQPMLHAWDWGTGTTGYVCGRTPIQRSGGTAAVFLDSQSPASLRRARRLVECKNCLSRLARLGGRGGGR